MKRIEMILTNKKGYRNNEYFGEGYTDFKEVLRHEIGELCNVDVLDTLKDLYPEDFNESKQSYMSDEVILRINSGNEKEENIIAYVDDIFNILQKKLNTEKNLKVVWVCATEVDVLNNYTFEQEIDEDEEFDFSDEPICDVLLFEEPFFIISNLEDEGFLIATTDYYIG